MRADAPKAPPKGVAAPCEGILREAAGELQPEADEASIGIIVPLD
jgi:hypothetical protein